MHERLHCLAFASKAKKKSTFMEFFFLKKLKTITFSFSCYNKRPTHVMSSSSQRGSVKLYNLPLIVLTFRSICNWIGYALLSDSHAAKKGFLSNFKIVIPISWYYIVLDQLLSAPLCTVNKIIFENFPKRQISDLFKSKICLTGITILWK